MLRHGRDRSARTAIWKPRHVRRDGVEEAAVAEPAGRGVVVKFVDAARWAVAEGDGAAIRGERDGVAHAESAGRRR